ncbi:MAG: hypothetical protein A2V99_00670 [Spirochaetes bacterium RBG_16_67_19]|nr:MAG: hypothetical protein A2V99_00670 [Spirochaetes bacterium RBG_16_67_19]
MELHEMVWGPGGVDEAQQQDPCYTCGKALSAAAWTTHPDYDFEIPDLRNRRESFASLPDEIRICNSCKQNAKPAAAFLAWALKQHQRLAGK